MIPATNHEQVLAHLNEVVERVKARLADGTLKVVTMTVASDKPDGNVSVSHWVEGTGTDALIASDLFQDFIHRNILKTPGIDHEQL